MKDNCSHIIKSEQSTSWLSSENSGNNAWNYNSDNGNLNNNNKMNSNGVRGAFEFDCEEMMSEQFVSFYAKYLDYYRETRKHKRGKHSQLIFECNLQDYLLPLCWDIYKRQYIPKPSNCFVVTNPTYREVIAAWFGDRIPQTRVVRQLMPLLDRYFFHPDSYSCRVGKGSLRAAEQVIWHCRMQSNFYRIPLWIYKFDLRNFFMSIDMKIFFKEFAKLVNEFVVDENDRDEILYLGRIIYLSYSQEHCIMKSHPELRKHIAEGKTLIGKTNNVGLPIGNITSQMLSLIVTTFILRMLVDFGLKFAHYTDDNCGVTRDKESFLKFMRWLANELQQRYGLTIHPHKFHLQYYKKPVNFLGYKIMYGSYLAPGNRLAHNFKWKIECYIRKAELYTDFIYWRKEQFSCTLCSYLGLLKHTASYNLRREQIQKVIDSRWSIVFDFDTENYYKVSIKKDYTEMAYRLRKNKQRKLQLKTYYNELI